MLSIVHSRCCGSFSFSHTHRPPASCYPPVLPASRVLFTPPPLPSYSPRLKQQQQQCSAFSFSVPRAIFERQTGNIAHPSASRPALSGGWSAARKRDIGELHAAEVDIGLRLAQVRACVCCVVAVCMYGYACVCACACAWVSVKCVMLKVTRASYPRRKCISGGCTED